MSVSIKNVILGEGETKICVPIIGKTKEEILAEAASISTVDADIVEWRVDFFENVMSIPKVLELILSLVDILNEKPILFTFRSKTEGGELDINEEAYIELIKAVINQNIVGAVDVEVFKGEKTLENIVAYAKDFDVKVIASNHDFCKTPDKEEIKRRLILMKEKGAHVSKMAVMPQNAADVLTLLSATEELHREYKDMTIITMSMGQLGVVSRISGGVFGSVMTFGARNSEAASAPGQVEVGALKEIMDKISKK